MASTDPHGVVTISTTLYESLMQDQDFLACLEAVGVDNWDGYETACQLHDGEITEEDI
jgi:hypothetical protein